MAKQVLIIGAGLGSLATALRLSSKGYKVRILEKHHQAGGRLNQFKKEGFTFDLGPSFFSMSYEFKELFDYCKVANPLQFNALDPLYSVYFSNRDMPYHIYKDLAKLAKEFGDSEPDFERKARRYLAKAKAIFEDTEYRIVKRNYSGKLDYAMAMAGVPLKHAPALFRTMWQQLSRYFDGEDTKIIFSLVAFFLGATPFDTPAVYSLLNYTELEHDGYWNIKGGMYKIVEQMLVLLEQNGVEFVYNTEIVSVVGQEDAIRGLKDQHGQLHTADIYVCNSDAAAFRGQILNRKSFNTEKLDAMDWTLAPFTIYLGVKGKLEGLHHHNYFLGNNFKQYSSNIFKLSINPEKPYYYVNASSKSNPETAPEGCENLFILCPVPDLRYKPDWSDSQQLAENIIADLSERIGYDIKSNIITQTIYNPIDWQKSFNLYQGSGLGLAHGLNQVGGLRPSNKDEIFNNLYYVGASTTPGTGLPIVVISSRLVSEHILSEHPN